MIKLSQFIKEFTGNSKETPRISYGNESRDSYTMPSLQNQDMNSIKSIYPIEDMTCLECDGQIEPNGYCSDCGKESHENDVWGQPDSGHQATMARAEIKDMIKNASQLYNIIQPGTELPGWVAAYITLASDYIHSVNEYAQERSSH